MFVLISEFKQWFFTNEARFSIMLACFVLLFIIEPFVNIFSSTSIILNIISSFILLSAVHNCSAESKMVSYFTAVLCVLSLSGKWIVNYHHNVFVSASSFLLGAVVIIITCFFILKHIKKTRLVKFDTIAGAICVYLLIGILGGMTFEMVELFLPGSFKFPQPFTVDAQSLLSSGNLQERLIYFSYTTLTSVGYGDIIPVSVLARSTTMVLAIFGQLYLAVVMAIIVGIYISSSRSSSIHINKQA